MIGVNIVIAVTINTSSYAAITLTAISVPTTVAITLAITSSSGKASSNNRNNSARSSNRGMSA